MNKTENYDDAHGDGFEFDLSEHETDAPVERKSICLWVPVKYKQKFDKIQARTRKKYGKHLQRLLMKSLDQVRVEDEAS